jgi:putative peptide zinc metalloprotease protein
LREDIRLLDAATNHDGTLAWMIQDPINNRFFRIGWLEFEILVRWPLNSAIEIADQICAETTLDIDADDVGDMVQFLQNNNLVKADTSEAVDGLISRASEGKKSGFAWLLKHYLFFRIPILRPQHILAQTRPLWEWIFDRRVAMAVIVMTVLGLYLVIRQWETFATTFIDQMTLSGLAGYMAALVFAKLLHELGHALTATYYGVRVAHMGVAMVVMFPMLYTDTSESWKLTNSRQRLKIASAGVIAELGLAGLATLAWSLAPDGSFRSALFFLATTSWVLSVLINISPFMRFDGYFVFADAIDMPNLHERAGAFAKQWLRKSLWGLQTVWPEPMTSKQRNGLVAFALATWVYRFIAFLGIALLVYYFFFKLLGIILMIVELFVFIGKPIWAELQYWHSVRDQIKTKRKIWVFGIIFISFLILLLPWQSHVTSEGWLHAKTQQQLFSPVAARVVSIPTEGQVNKDTQLFTLESPELSIAEKRAVDLAQARQQELAGLLGVYGGEEKRIELQYQQQQFLAEAMLHRHEQQRLNLIAGFDGVVYDVDPNLAKGVWVQPRQPLAMLADISQWVFDAYVEESDVARISIRAPARVSIAAGRNEFITGTVVAIDATPTVVLPHHVLDASSGGNVVTIPNRDNQMIPRDAIYRVRVELSEQPNRKHMALGNVVIEGERRAILPRIVSRIVAVIIRETGF